MARCYKIVLNVLYLNVTAAGRVQSVYTIMPEVYCKGCGSYISGKAGWVRNYNPEWVPKCQSCHKRDEDNEKEKRKKEMEKYDQEMKYKLSESQNEIERKKIESELAGKLQKMKADMEDKRIAAGHEMAIIQEAVKIKKVEFETKMKEKDNEFNLKKAAVEKEKEEMQIKHKEAVTQIQAEKEAKVKQKELEVNQEIERNKVQSLKETAKYIADTAHKSTQSRVQAIQDIEEHRMNMIERIEKRRQKFLQKLVEGMPQEDKIKATDKLVPKIFLDVTPALNSKAAEAIASTETANVLPQLKDHLQAIKAEEKDVSESED